MINGMKQGGALLAMTRFPSEGKVITKKYGFPVGTICLKPNSILYCSNKCDLLVRIDILNRLKISMILSIVRRLCSNRLGASRETISLKCRNLRTFKDMPPSPKSHAQGSGAACHQGLQHRHICNTSKEGNSHCAQPGNLIKLEVFSLASKFT